MDASKHTKIGALHWLVAWKLGVIGSYYSISYKRTINVLNKIAFFFNMATCY